LSVRFLKDEYNDHMTTTPLFITSCKQIELASFSGVCTECKFDREYFNDSLFSNFKILFPAQLDKAVTKRKAEFLAGRYVAKESFIKAGIPLADITIGEQRAPIWPASIRGSITHNGEYALCAITQEPDSIGIDIETMMSFEMANSIKSSLVNSAEEALSKHYQGAFEEWLSLVFSIKESLFKALYPGVQKYFDFLDAQVVKIDPINQSISLVLLTDLTPSIQAGQHFSGFYQLRGDSVLTWVHCANIYAEAQ